MQRPPGLLQKATRLHVALTPAAALLRPGYRCPAQAPQRQGHQLAAAQGTVL